MLTEEMALDFIRKINSSHCGICGHCLYESIHLSGNLGAIENAGVIASHLSDQSPRIRAITLQALFRMGAPEIGNTLQALLEMEQHPEIRVLALSLQARMGVHAAQKAMTALIDGEKGPEASLAERYFNLANMSLAIREHNLQKQSDNVDDGGREAGSKDLETDLANATYKVEDLDDEVDDEGDGEDEGDDWEEDDADDDVDGGRLLH